MITVLAGLVSYRSVEAAPEDSSIFKKTKNLMKQDSSKDKSVEVCGDVCVGVVWVWE